MTRLPTGSTTRLLDWVPDSSLEHLQAASVSYRIAIGPHAGRKTLTL